MRQFIFILTFLYFLSAHGQTNNIFPNLTRVSIDTTYKVFFGYEKKNTQLINVPCHRLNKKDPLFCSDDESELVSWLIVGKFKNDNTKDSLIIIYSEGMSADPGFEILTKSNKLIGRFSCTEFYINGLGTIYTSGHVNNMYNRKRKFQIQKDTIFEVRQPYCYVGLKGKILKNIVLYKDRVGTEMVAQLPKGYEIEVLLADGGTADFKADLNYLVKTDFGLVGWLRITNEDTFGGILEGLYYAGD